MEILGKQTRKTHHTNDDHTLLFLIQPQHFLREQNKTTFSMKRDAFSEWAASLLWTSSTQNCKLRHGSRGIKNLNWHEIQWIHRYISLVQGSANKKATLCKLFLKRNHAEGEVCRQGKNRILFTTGKQSGSVPSNLTNRTTKSVCATRTTWTQWRKHGVAVPPILRSDDWSATTSVSGP